MMKNETTQRKAEDEKAKKHDITSHFYIGDKNLRKKNKQVTKSMIKNSSMIKTDLTTPFNITMKQNYSYVTLDTPPEIDYIDRCEKVHRNLVKAMKEEDLDAFTTHYEDQYEK